jgi:glyoxylase-like metal-dependent hydrolase (beta-lactamase superfamily II)
VQHKNSPLPKDISCSDSDILSIGNLKLKVIHTPGHSQDSICLLCDDGKFVLTGDTLFVGNCGRTDLPGSSSAELYHSLFDKLSNLEDSLVVYPGHDYGATPTSTIGNEKKTNFVLRPRTEEEFVQFMSHGD